MNESSSSLRITRGSPLHVNVVDILPSFSMRLTQDFGVNVGSLGKSKQVIQEQTMEELRSKEKNDPMAVQQLIKNVKARGIKIVQGTRKRKDVNIESEENASEVVGSEELHNHEEVRYICKNREKRTIHMQCYTQINTLNELQNKLPSNQYNRICASLRFAQLTAMRRCHVQAQLFRCIVLRELEGSSVNAILFYINGTTLRFTIREFAIISGLNCSDNGADFYFDTDQPNRIIDEYFSGNSPVTKARLAEAFKAKVWGDNQEDAYKFGILYYIDEFIMSVKTTTTTIDRLDFDLVETGRFMDYPWGRKAFNELAKSINNKIKPCGQYYKIQGFPLPMQVWFYECCSYVDDKIAVKVSSHIPRIINWVTKNDHPRFDCFMKIIFNDADNPIKFKNIEPTAMEIKILKLPPSTEQSISQGTDHNKVTDPDDDFKNPPSITSRKGKEKVIECSSPIRKKKKQSVTVISINKSSTKAIKTYTRRSMARKATRSQSININSVEKHSDAAFKKLVKDEFADLRKMLEDKFKTVLEAMNSKATFEDVMQETHITRVHQSNTKSSQLGAQKKPIGHPSALKNHELGDNLQELNQNSPLLDQVVLGDNLNDVSGTASQDQLVLYANVDAQQNAQRETESSSNSRETVVTESQDELPDHLLPSVNTLQNIVLQKQVEAEVTPMPAVRHRRSGPFNISPYMTSFGSDAGSSSRQPVVFYMKHPFVSLSDKEESDLFSNFWIWLKEDLLDRYKKGKATLPQLFNFGVATIDNKNWFYNIGFERQLIDNSMLAYAPWHTVDDVFIPVNLEGRLHWILIVISFNDRCIKVYDSINNSLHHSFVVNHIKKYAQLIPMYLVKSDLYLKKGFDIASHHRYQGHTVYDSFEIVYVEDLPQKLAASLDCGVYVASYAEFLSERKDIPADIDPEEIRLRYSALLWNCGNQKIQAGAVSDSEAPLKPVRNRTENNSSERITIH
ncbi:uncharacterized protein [Solanum lycopersicum]|uniref:uncharacterized protein n=1 Tax=Solanum lycopersicum TaxID=4081 RepID=UPI0037478791